MRLPSYQQLSKEQDGVCNLPLNDSFLVTGPPGTGKSVLALHRAAMLSKQNRDWNLLTYSNLLSIYVHTAQKELGLKHSRITTFHKWMYKFWSQYHGSNFPPQSDKYIFDWERILPLVIRQEQGLSSTSVLIDEGQDLPEDFYTMLRLLLHKCRQDCSATVFADENQQIYQTQSTIAEIKQRMTIPDSNVRLLTVNYRNTREIALLARQFYVGLPTGMPELPQRHGERPEVRRMKSRKDLTRWIARYVRLHRDQMIGVFTETIAEQKALAQTLRKELDTGVQCYNFKAKNSMDFTTPGVKLVTYRSAKGLEFDAVFIPELQRMSLAPDDPTTRMLFYVLISRARERLFLSWSGDDPPAFMNEYFPAELTEWVRA